MPQNCPIFITWQLGDNVALQKRTKYSTIKDSCNAMYDPSTVSLISLRRTFNSKISHTTRNQFLQTPASDETPKRIYPLWKWHRCWLKQGTSKNKIVNPLSMKCDHLHIKCFFDDKQNGFAGCLCGSGTGYCYQYRCILSSVYGLELTFMLVLVLERKSAIPDRSK